jgi:hypothetical protein
MLRHCVKPNHSLKGLRTDKQGLVSFEYVVAAFCIVATVVAVFGANGVGLSPRG